MSIPSLGRRIFVASAFQDRLLSAAVVLWAIVGQLTSADHVIPIDVVAFIVAILGMRFLIGHVRLHNLILAISFLVLLAFSLFAVFVLNVFDAVVPEAQFNFSVFSFANVRTVFVSNSACLAAFMLAASCVTGIYQSSSMFAKSEGSPLGGAAPSAFASCRSCFFLAIAARRISSASR